MPELSSDRQEMFARCLASNNMTQAEAAAEAGYTLGPSLAGTASRLANKPEVAARIFELQNQHHEHSGCDTEPSRADLIDRCMAVYQLSISQERSADALKALALVGELRGYLRKSISVHAEQMQKPPTVEERQEAAAQSARVDAALKALDVPPAPKSDDTTDDDQQEGDASKA